MAANITEFMRLFRLICLAHSGNDNADVAKYRDAAIAGVISLLGATNDAFNSANNALVLTDDQDTSRSY